MKVPNRFVNIEIMLLITTLIAHLSVLLIIVNNVNMFTF